MISSARRWSERYATVDGVRVVFDDSAGADPPVVVLHGFLGSGSAMVPLVEALDEHGALAGRRIVTVDLVGHGRSDAPARVGPYVMARVVHQILTVLDRLVDPTHGPGPVDLLGYSMGGRVALAAGVAGAGRLRRLILIGATAGIEDPAERRARRENDAELARFVRRHGVDAFVDRWEQLPIFATQRALPGDVREQVRRARVSQRAVGVANSLRGTGTGSMEPMWGRLDDVVVPTLVLAGALDAKYVEIGRRLAQALPHGVFSAIAGAGHAAHIEQPAATAEAVAAFLAAPDAPRRSDGDQW